MFYRHLIAALAVFIALFSSATAAEPLALTVQAVLLNPEVPAQQRLGNLRWRGGLEISAANPNFGGLSGLLLSPDGKDMTAVTDRGYRLTAKLHYDRSFLTNVSEAAIAPLLNPKGKALKGKKNQDAEALALQADGAVLVAFERNHRVLRYSGGDESPSLISLPPALFDGDKNDGIEALVTLNDGALLAIVEGPEETGDTAAYLRREGTWHTLSYQRQGLYRPSGATRLPDGDLLVIERRFTLLGGPSIRFVRIAVETIQPDARLQGAVMAVLQLPLTVDNIEGVDARLGAKGETLITVISDDNFNPLQRTLLLVFALEN